MRDSETNLVAAGLSELFLGDSTLSDPTPLSVNCFTDPDYPEELHSCYSVSLSTSGLGRKQACLLSEIFSTINVIHLCYPESCFELLVSKHVISIFEVCVIRCWMPVLNATNQSHLHKEESLVTGDMEELYLEPFNVVKGYPSKSCDLLYGANWEMIG